MAEWLGRQAGLMGLIMHQSKVNVHQWWCKMVDICRLIVTMIDLFIFCCVAFNSLCVHVQCTMYVCVNCQQHVHVQCTMYVCVNCQQHVHVQCTMYVCVNCQQHVQVSAAVCSQCIEPQYIVHVHMERAVWDTCITYNACCPVIQQGRTMYIVDCTKTTILVGSKKWSKADQWYMWLHYSCLGICKPLREAIEQWQFSH